MQMQIFSICFQVLNSGERIVQMVFIRFQYHLQRHFVVLVVARLVVDITIMQVPIATRRFVFIPMDLQDLSVGLLQVPNKQWGTCVSGINNLPLSFNEKIFICVVTDITSSTNSSDGYFSFNNEKSTINSIFITSSGAHGGNYIVAGV